MRSRRASRCAAPTAPGATSTPRRRCRARTDAGAAATWRRRIATAAAGAAVATGLSGCFSAPPQIVTLEPNHGSTSVPADAPVRVLFDKPVQPESVVGHFSVSPALPGCDLTAAFRAASTAPCWILWLPGNSGFELFHEDAVFAPATRYEFTLSGGFTDSAGNRNGLDHHWDLTTAAAPHTVAFVPAAGSTGVAVDAPIAVGFSTPMDATSTANAVTLSPPVPGTRVVQNALDHSRFVVLPGRLLAPGTTYTLTVGPGARGEDNQRLAGTSPLTARFTTGAHVSLSHAAVLAAVPGEAATVVALPPLAPAVQGEPAPAPVVLSAARCESAAGCGGVPPGAPLQTFAAAAVSADSAHLAVIADGTAGGSAELEVVDALRGLIEARFTGALQPSWSPGGALLAFTVAGEVVVYDAVHATETTVATGTSLAAPPLWAGESSLVLSEVDGTGRPATLSVVNLALDARYGVPGAPVGSIAVASAPGGTAVAVETPGEGALVLSLSGTAAPVRLAAGLTPVGFIDRTTLVAASFAGDRPALVRVDLAGGDTATIGLGATADLATVRVDQTGRRIAFLGFDAGGVLQAYAANADGSATTALTRFGEGDLEAEALDIAP